MKQLINGYSYSVNNFADVFLNTTLKRNFITALRNLRNAQLQFMN